MRRDHGHSDARTTSQPGLIQADSLHTIATPASAAMAQPTGTSTPASDAAFAARRIELILQQLDALPTLGVVAVKLLQRTNDENANAREIIELIECDPALASKVIKLCRCSHSGRAIDVTSVERAVKVLGFEALRSAALSVQVFEIFDRMESPGGERRDHSNNIGFDRAMFWRHSLAVALLCESLAGFVKTGEGPGRSTIAKAEAYTAGLLHDLGMLALHVLLPRTFDRVGAHADSNGISLDHACRRVIGVDTHTAGRRLAEHWRLPHSLGDVLWLHGQPIDSLPAINHRSLIALVTLSDILARRQGIAPTGDGPRGEEIQELTAYLQIGTKQIDSCLKNLRAEVDARAETLGIHQALNTEALLVSVSRANETLGRMNAGLRQSAMQAQRQAASLRAITDFHDQAAPSTSVIAVMGKVVESASALFGGGFFAMLYQARMNDPWQITQYAIDGRPLRSDLISPPPGSTAVSDLADNTQVSMNVMGMLPWLCDYLGDSRDLRDMQLLPLRCGWGVSAVLLHDCPVDGQEAREPLNALSRTWAAAIAAAAQHEGAKALGDQLAESNRALIETQSQLTQSQAMAALGEIAAGAAHEMNNPLTVISGRSQLLARTLTDPQAKAMAEQIAEQSHKISDMITALRMLAEPGESGRPQVRHTPIAELLDTAIAETTAEFVSPPRINLIVENGLPPVFIDPHQISRTAQELLRNAIESENCSYIEVRVQIEPVNDRLKISVLDNGKGLTAHELSHAFDPFFSSKPAGRQPGLGLARARRWVEAHGGRLTLENGLNGGALAIIRLSDWRGQDTAEVHHRDAA